MIHVGEECLQMECIDRSYDSGRCSVIVAIDFLLQDTENF